MNLLRSAVLLAVTLGVASTLLPAARKPLQRPKLEKIEHQPTGTRVRVDRITGESVAYMLEGNISYDPVSHNFSLAWIGHDGNSKSVVYNPPSKVDVVVSGRVDWQPAGRFYRYSYSLHSLPSSGQKLGSFYLETRSPVDGMRSPDGSWALWLLSDYLKEQLRVREGLTWSQVMQGRDGLRPGESAAGFSFHSGGLPTVVACYVRGRTELRGGQGEEIPEELHAAIDEVAWRIPKGVTVGPADPPQRFEADSFLSAFHDYLGVSLQNGWIESTQVAEQIDKSLELLRQTIKSGERKRTDRILRELLSRIETEKDKTLLSEAYALLKFNLEYLQQRLQGK
jgi:hypothetical protein